MKHSLRELVSIILERLQSHPDSASSETGLRTWLARQGFAKRDIDAAMKLVRPRVRAIQTELGHGPEALRCLTAYELYKLTPEARDAIARVERYGLLSPDERELILERLDHFEGEVGVEELDYLFSWLVSPARDVENQNLLYQVLEGNTQIRH